jgi:flagellar assembly protein FliH
MSDPRPFSFDQDFGDGGRSAPVTERRKRVYLADEVDLIREFALNEGQTSVTTRLKEAELHALQQIAEAARSGLTILAQVAREHRTGAAELALAAARKIAGGALAHFPSAPIQAALEALGREIESQPRLVIRMSEPSDEVRAAVDGAARDAGFTGQIVFKPDPGPVTAAFVIEWGDGRAAFDPQAAAARIAEAFESALAAEGVHGDALGTPTGAPDHLSPPGA